MNFFGCHCCMDEVVLVMALIPFIGYFFRAAKARVINHTCCSHHAPEVQHDSFRHVEADHPRAHSESRRENLPN